MVDTVVGILATVLAGTIGWAGKTQSRVAVLERGVEDAKELATERTDGLKELIEEKFDSMDQRLARIERAMNGQLRGH